MLGALIKKQLLELFQTYFVDKKTGKARKSAGTIIYILLGVGVFGGVGFAIYSMAGGLGIAMLDHGFNWLYFALMGLLSIALGVFGSVFNTYASLYLPKDNEFLFSLPIPNTTLLIARILSVYLISLLYSAWVWIPTMIAYWQLVSLNVLNVLFPILLTFVVALFVTILSCALGWVVAIIASKAKGKSFLTVFLSIFVFAAYYVVYFKVVGSINEILDHLDEIGSVVKSWLHFSFFLGNAADGQLMYMLIVTAITVLLFAICVAILSRTFTGIALSEKKTEKKVEKAEDYKGVSATKAMLNREFKHFTSSSTWMLNGAIGVLFMPAVAIIMLIKSESFTALIAELGADAPMIVEGLPIFVFAIVCLLATMNNISASSISMEGKNLWIVQSLPVDAWEVLRAKRDVDIRVTGVPAVVTVLVLGYVARLDVVSIILVLLAVMLFIMVKASLGLVFNLKSPNLTWVNEAAPTKQSLAVTMITFGGWLICAVLGIGGFFLAQAVGVSAVLGIIAVLLAIIYVIIRGWLKKKGAAILKYL